MEIATFGISTNCHGYMHEACLLDEIWSPPPLPSPFPIHECETISIVLREEEEGERVPSISVGYRVIDFDNIP